MNTLFLLLSSRFEGLTLVAQVQAPEKSLLDHIRSGGPIGYVIIVLSFAAMVLAIMHLIQIRRARLAPPEVVERLDTLLASGDVQGALRYATEPENECFLTRVFAGALMRCSRSAFGFLELRTALEEAGKQQVDRLHRTVDGIGLIGAVAPMLGLLGTVVGMVGAFETISATEGFAKPAQLAGSISVALITTVLGLLVAIPCTAAHSYFRHRIDDVTSGIGETIEELAAHVQASPGGQAPKSVSPATRRSAQPAEASAR